MVLGSTPAAMGRDRSRSPRGNNTEDIVRLVIAREQARLGKDWAAADTTREQLSALGVTLFDKNNNWRCEDGRTGRIPNWSEMQDGDAVQTLIAGELGSNMKVPEFDESSEEGQIKQLIRAREQARAKKDFAESDNLRDQLKAMGVEMLDKEKIWKKTETGLAGVIVGYSDKGISDMEISVLVVQREKARAESNFPASDMIRDELRSYGVEIEDKKKLWRTNDGRTGHVPSWSEVQNGMAGGAPPAHGWGAPPMPPPMMYGGKGGKGGKGYGNVMDVQSQIVEAALAAAMNPATAQRTLQLLQQGAGMAPPAYGGKGKGKWGNDQGSYGQPAYGQPAKGGWAPPAAKGGGKKSKESKEALTFINQAQVSGRQLQDPEIQWLVEVREKLRLAKDYSGGDEVRQAMRNSLQVEIHDKEHCWRSADGREGSIPNWDNLQ